MTARSASVLWDSAAFNAGLTVGSQIVAINGRNFDGDALKQAIKAAAGNGAGARAADPRRRRLPHGQARLAWRPALSAAREDRQGAGHARRSARAALTRQGGGMRCAIADRHGTARSLPLSAARAQPRPAETNVRAALERIARDRPAAPFGDRGRSRRRSTRRGGSTAGNLRGPLAGQPVLIKDNIEAPGRCRRPPAASRSPTTSPTATRRWSRGCARPAR